MTLGLDKEIGGNTDNVDKHYDKASDMTVVKVYSGDCYITDKPKEMMVTILGSCVSACIRDPIAKIGGMNHFLLPDSKSEPFSSTRYGAFAMEKLINEILKRGGQRHRLEVKVFGGGNVIESSARIGEKNVEFIKSYLKNEGIPIAMSDLGGTAPRRIHYYPDTGKVMMRKIEKKEDVENVKKEENKYSQSINVHSQHGDEGDVELF